MAIAIEYFCCYHSYRRKIAKLSDQEVGRLFRSLLAYSETGAAQELTGREAIAFDFIADDLDRARENYAARCRTNAENGRRGGRPPGSGKAAAFSGTEAAQTKDETEAEGETEGELPPPLPPGEAAGFTGELGQAVSDWLAYKAERGRRYKPTGLKSLLGRITQAAATYGDAAVAAVIRESMAANYQGIVFDRLGRAAPAEDRREIQRRAGILGAASPTREELERIQRLTARMGGTGCGT